MDWIQRLNKAIDYIENNLSGNISYDKAAEIACCSTYHFQRMFSYIAGVPLSVYIRRRRMTLAAIDLQDEDTKIIDTALKYGYESPTSFNRAFQSIHGISPSLARVNGVSLKAYQKISFLISIKGDQQMNYRIEQKEAFRIVGVKEHFNMSVEECFEEAPQFWQRTAQSGVIPQILSQLDGKIPGLLGLSTCSKNGEEFDYYIAVSSENELPKGMSEFEVPGTTWAIFECIGAMPQSIQELQKRIVTEWLPSSGYEYANAPDIEVYFEGDQQSDDYKCEVWLPIIKK